MIRERAVSINTGLRLVIYHYNILTLTANCKPGWNNKFESIHSSKVATGCPTQLQNEALLRFTC